MSAARARRVLISGASGFVGARLARRMIERGDEVHVIERPRHGAAAPWRTAEVMRELRVHTADLLDAEATRRAVAVARPEVVLHFAAHAALPQEIDEMEIFLNTVQPLVNLAAASAGCALFINAGSSSEYGYQTQPMSEASLPDPTRVHDIAKLAQTLYGTYAARFKGVPLVTLRLFSVYGPFEHGRRLIPRLMLSALRGQPMKLSSPDVSRDFIFVDDVVRAVEHCMDQGAGVEGSVFNLGTGIEHSIREAAELVESIHGRPLPLEWGAVVRQPWDSPRWVADTTRQTEVLGYTAQTSFRDGLAATYRWFAEHIHRYEEYGQHH
ncbi:NAD-dependent epimerase/dehydratase family protein [Chelatococcus sp. GCM10030263]|uniref:NAD-dependent epimerase/dehydratase family protein n=1 Tax=Chelatococcus sp. GCM10030263 TaxID=3273387 RepID=UPI00361FECA7